MVGCSEDKIQGTQACYEHVADWKKSVHDCSKATINGIQCVSSLSWWMSRVEKCPLCCYWMTIWWWGWYWKSSTYSKLEDLFLTQFFILHWNSMSTLQSFHGIDQFPNLNLQLIWSKLQHFQIVMRITFFFSTAYLIWLGQWKVPQYHCILKKDKISKENIVNRFSNAQKIFSLCLMLCISVIIYACWKLRMVGNLAKWFLAKPAPSVGILPCNIFTFVQWIYQGERKEASFHAKCNFFFAQ